MLSVIESSMGSFAEFNGWARRVFEQRMLNTCDVEVGACAVDSRAPCPPGPLARGVRDSLSVSLSELAAGVAAGVSGLSTRHAPAHAAAHAIHAREHWRRAASLQRARARATA